MKFDLIRFGDRILNAGARLTGKATSDSKQDAIDRAYVEAERIVGRFDVPQSVPSRVLHDVKPDDIEAVKTLGAKFDEEKKQWIVPETIHDLTLFHLWWTPVPEDLRDSDPRWTLTRDGRRAESYILPEDIAEGADSTVTSIMYGALPIVAALSYAATMLLSQALGLAVLLLGLPFLVAITQGEGIKEGIKSALMLLLIPAFGAGAIGAASGLGAGLAGSLPVIGSIGGVLAVFFGMTMLFTVVILVWSLLFADKDSKPMGGFFERLKHSVKWGAMFAAIFMVVGVLPAWMAPAALLMMACLYPMHYTEHNWQIRSQLLKENGEMFNISTQGSLSNAHVGARLRQCQDALRDTTPLLHIGTSVGHLTKKQYGYAPDPRTKMVLSCLDLSMHVLVFGATGVGKTSNTARPIILQYKQSRYGGALIRCGKGTLPGELRSIIDIMVEPGVRFGPFMGLDHKDLAIALNSLQVGDGDPRNAIWVSGANNVLDHATLILQELVAHEKRIKALAVEKAREIEDLITEAQALLARQASISVDTSNTRELLDTLIARHLEWADARDSARKFLWTPKSLLDLLYAMNEVVVDHKGVSSAGKEMMSMAEFLGYSTNGAVPSSNVLMHPDIGKRSLLDGSLDFVMRSWPRTDEAQRSSFMINVLDRIIPLVRGRDLRSADGTPWSETEEGIDVSQALYGKFVGVNLPVNQHGTAATTIASLVRQRIYSGIRMRQDHKDWRKALPDQTPVMDMVDECQLIVSKEELDMAPIARSLGLMMVMLTQGFEGLETAFGSHVKADQFCNQFQSLICMRASEPTYQYLMKRFGTAMVVKYEQPVAGIDFDGGLANAIHSPLNDVNHPLRSAMRKMKRLGAGRFEIDRPGSAGGEWQGHRARGLADSDISKGIRVPTGGKKVIEPVFLPEEFPALLAERGRAILWLHRAGVARVDVATLKHVGVDEIPETNQVSEIIV